MHTDNGDDGANNNSDVMGDHTVLRPFSLKNRRAKKGAMSKFRNRTLGHKQIVCLDYIKLSNFGQLKTFFSHSHENMIVEEMLNAKDVGYFSHVHQLYSFNIKITGLYKVTH